MASIDFAFSLCLRAMLCLDEIRGRLAEVFSLKSYKIDHVLFGSIASAIVYGTLLGESLGDRRGYQSTPEVGTQKGSLGHNENGREYLLPTSDGVVDF